MKSEERTDLQITQIGADKNNSMENGDKVRSYTFYFHGFIGIYFL